MKIIKILFLASILAFLFPIARAQPQPMGGSTPIIRVPNCGPFTLPYQVCQDLDTGELKVGNNSAAVAAGSQQTVYDNGICTTTMTINANNGARQKVTLGGNCAITFAVPTMSTYVFLKVIQHSGAHYNLSWPNAKWAAGLVPLITQSDAAVDVISCYLDTEGVYCQFSQDFH